MNKVILLVLFVPALAHGQIMENFENGIGPEWFQLPEGHWIADGANSISGNLSMFHNYDSQESGNDIAGFELKNLHPSEGKTRWGFRIRYGCDPSSMNNWAVFLMSDSKPDTAVDNTVFNGYAIGVNQTGYDDTLRLWKVRDGKYYNVIRSHLNWQNDIGTSEDVLISIERSSSGQWDLKVYDNTDSLIDLSSGNDPELFYPGWLILSYRYTATRDRLLWFDDLLIEGIFYVDTLSPDVTGCEVYGRNTLKLSFNEELSFQSLNSNNYSLAGEENSVTDIIKLSVTAILIEFEKPFANGKPYSLFIHMICDRMNNCRNSIAVSFSPKWPIAGDVVITEIMADPLPSVSLPGKEYLEITNLSDISLNLSKWFLDDSKQKYYFPDSMLWPEEHKIICSIADTGLFSTYGGTIGLKSFPALTDNGKILALCDSSGTLIHGIEYSHGWYGDELKSGGGWSLEMIDQESPFHDGNNWQASASRDGGTPGRPNSVSRRNPDLNFDGITKVFPPDSMTLILRLSETILGLGDQITSVKINDNTVKDLIPDDPLKREFILTLYEPVSRGKIYSLIIDKGIKDFAGNLIERNEFRFGIPEISLPGDILFNELLFNPVYGEPDYIEFYNASSRIIDASRLIIVSVNDDRRDTSSSVRISEEGRCILPGDYYAITTDRKKVIDRFFSCDPIQLFEVSALPSMPDDKGHLILFSMELEKIDEVFYNEGMQYSLLQQNEGVSLEKVRPQSVSSEKSGWHSASEAAGWGTPGTVNSVYSPEPAVSNQVILSSSKITPDNDGYEDFLIIDLQFPGTGNVVSVNVFDETGNFVKKIADNLLAGPQADVIWDGTDESGSIVQRGIYIMLISVFDETGRTWKLKKVCSVIR
jgi:hypothetical protein